MLNWNEPLQTVKGLKVRLICSDRKKIGYPYLCLVETGGKSADELIYCYTKAGEALGNYNKEFNLVNVPKIIKCSFILYKHIDTDELQIYYRLNKDMIDTLELFKQMHEHRIIQYKSIEFLV